MAIAAVRAQRVAAVRATSSVKIRSAKCVWRCTRCSTADRDAIDIMPELTELGKRYAFAETVRAC